MSSKERLEKIIFEWKKLLKDESLTEEERSEKIRRLELDQVEEK